jgi:hypothetical protein
LIKNPVCRQAGINRETLRHESTLKFAACVLLAKIVVIKYCKQPVEFNTERKNLKN